MVFCYALVLLHCLYGSSPIVGEVLGGNGGFMGIMDIIGGIISIFNKMLPSRKGALIEQIKTLTAEYEAALQSGDDTRAATLKKQIDELRSRGQATGGDV